MICGSRWVAQGALVLGGGFIVAACATGGPGVNPLGFASDEGGSPATGDGGIANNMGSGSPASGGTGLNNSTDDNASGDDATGASGGNAPATCDPSACPSGCCSNGVCASGMDNAACGQGGSDCVDCTTTNQVCSFGSCVQDGQSSSGSTDPGPGSSSGGSTTPPPNPAGGGSCDLASCKNACFPLGLPCCTSAGACGCIALYFLPCK